MTPARKILEQIEALFESKWTKYLYHSTSSDFDPAQIRPGSHFGTLHAAMSREWDLGHRYNAPKHGRVLAYRYESPGKHIEMQDITPGWGESADLAIIAHHLMHHADPMANQSDPRDQKGAFIPVEDHHKFFDPITDQQRDDIKHHPMKDNVSFIYGHFGSVGGKKQSDPSEITSDDMMFNHHKFMDYMKSRGITSIQYKNHKEGKGTVSHIVLDPENLHPVHTFKDPKFMDRNVNRGGGEQEYFRRPPGAPEPKSSW